MSKSACKARRPTWVDQRIKMLRADPSNEHGLEEAELLDAAFSVSQSAVERSLSALRNLCNWKSEDQRCFGDLSYSALAKDAGIARSTFAASLTVLQPAGVILIGEGWNYNKRGHREPNSYAIGKGSFADQLRALKTSGVHISVPVNITLALLGAHDDLDGCSEITLEQLMTATGIPERVIREFVRGARKANKLFWLGGNRFRFAHAVWGPKPKSDLRGFPFKSDSGKRHVKSDSVRKPGRNIKSTTSQVEISRPNNDCLQASTSSSRARSRARAAADAAALRTDRRRLPFDEFIAKASCALDGRSLADLDDNIAYDLLLDAVAEVMQPRFMVSGREAGLALFRRCAEAWPTTTLMRQPDMLFRELWWKAEKIRQRGGNFSAWTYLAGFTDDVLAKYSQARFDAETVAMSARIRAAADRPPEFATVEPVPAAEGFDRFSKPEPARRTESSKFDRMSGNEVTTDDEFFPSLSWYLGEDRGNAGDGA